MDGKSVAEQALILSGARKVVGVHGAAMTNLIFARPQTQVVEFLSPNDPKSLYWHLAARVGLEYHAVVGIDRALCGPHAVEMNEADMVCDIDALPRIVGIG